MPKKSPQAIGDEPKPFTNGWFMVANPADGRGNSTHQGPGDANIHLDCAVGLQHHQHEEGSPVHAGAHGGHAVLHWPKCGRGEALTEKVNETWASAGDHGQGLVRVGGFRQETPLERGCADHPDDCCVRTAVRPGRAQGRTHPAQRHICH